MDKNPEYENVVKLWKRQFGPFDKSETYGYTIRYHPYTCANRGDHPDLAGDKGILVPTVRGWICPFCDYTQEFL